MNDEQINSVEGWAVAMASLQAYLDYVCRYKINELLQSGELEAENVDPDKVVAGLKQDIMELIAGDLSEYLPQTLDALGEKLSKAVGL